MKNKFVKFSLISLAAVSMVAGASFSLFNKGNGDVIPLRADQTETPVFSDVSLEETYPCGYAVSLPDATATYRGENVPVVKILHVPGGKASVVNKSVTLEEIGRYTLEYRCVVSGRAYSKKYEFSTFKKMFQLTSSTDVTTYCKDSDAVVETIKDRTDMAADYVGSGVYGQFVSLSKGEKLIINDYFDISKANLAQPLFSLSVVPAHKGGVAIDKTMYGTPDARTLKFRFISKSNPKEYLTMLGNYYLFNNCTFFQAGAQNQTPSGYEAHTDTLHVGNIWGAPTGGSFVGSPVNGRSLLADEMQMYLNYKDKKVYANTQKLSVVDLDDSKSFSSLWGGFTDPNVYVEISADNYTGTNPIQFILQSVGDLDLSKSSIVDTEAPVIKVDFASYQENDLPHGVVGMPYQLPSAVAEDWLSDNVKVETRVYGRYGTTTAFHVDVQNGVFTPKSAGTYTVEYSAKDYSGNTAEKRIEIQVDAAGTPLQMQVEKGETSASTGQVISLGKATATGGNGKVTMETKVEFEGKEESVSAPTFRVENAGEYTIKHIARDYVGQQIEDSYVVRVSANQEPIFIDEPMLPRYLISGSAYKLPSLNAYDYSSGRGYKTVPAIPVVRQNNQEIEVTSDYVPSGETVQIAYKATVNGNVAYSKPVDLTIHDVGNGRNLDMTKYFVSDDGITATASEKNIALTANDDGKVTFINRLMANNFTINFDVDAERNFFKEAIIRLEDPSSGAILKSSFVKTPGNQSYWSVNDGMQYTVDSSFNGNGLASFDFTYNEELRKISNYASDISFDVTRDCDGNPWEGFVSGYCYLTIEFVGVTQESVIHLKSICGQVMSNRAADSVKPRFSLMNRVALNYDIGDKIQLASAICVDVLDPNVKAYYSFYDPDNEIVKDVNGKEIFEFSIDQRPEAILNKYGSYHVEFYGEDWNGKREINFVYAVEVVDRLAPTITLSEDRVTKGHVGETIPVSTAVAEDALEGTIEKVGVFLTLPSGKVEKISNYSFVPSRPGQYTVTYYAYDSTGNTAKVSYSIVVEE